MKSYRSNRNRLSSTKLAASKCPQDTDADRPAVPSDYIRAFRQVLSRAARLGQNEIDVVPTSRVSGDKQLRNGNLDHQDDYLCSRIRTLGHIYSVKVNVHLNEVGRPFGEAVSAWKLWKSARPALVEAAKIAEKKGAILVAVDTTRYVRNKRHDRGVEPTVDDFEQLRGLVGNVTMTTLRFPDYMEDRGKNSARGIRAKDKSAGYKKRRRIGIRKDLRKLFADGIGNREIARMLETAESNVRRWRERYAK